MTSVAPFRAAVLSCVRAAIRGPTPAHGSMTCMCVGFLHVHTHDGKKKLAQGPELPSYRGVSIINSRKFSMAPRDMLRRRVRVSEHYRIPWDLDGCLNTDTSFFGAATQNCLDIKCKQKRCLLCTAKDFKNCKKI